MLNPHKSGFLPTAVIFYTLFTFAATASAGTYSGGSGTADMVYVATGKYLRRIFPKIRRGGWSIVKFIPVGGKYKRIARMEFE